MDQAFLFLVRIPSYLVRTTFSDSIYLSPRRIRYGAFMIAVWTTGVRDPWFGASAMLFEKICFFEIKRPKIQNFVFPSKPSESAPQCTCHMTILLVPVLPSVNVLFCLHWMVRNQEISSLSAFWDYPPVWATPQTLVLCFLWVYSSQFGISSNSNWHISGTFFGRGSL